MRIVVAGLRLAQGDPDAATAALAPVVDGTISLASAHLWVVHAFWLDAIARDAAGDAAGARRAWSTPSTWPRRRACSTRSWSIAPRNCDRGRPLR